MTPQIRKLVQTITRRVSRLEDAFVIGTVTAVGAGEVTVSTPGGEVDEVTVPQWYTPAVGNTVVLHFLDGDPYVVSAF